jgi:hypothetical protein
VIGEDRSRRPGRPSHGRIFQSLSGVASLIVERRWVFLAVLAALEAVPFHAKTPVDLAEFAAYGSHLWHGDFSQVYANPWNQSGPLQLLFCYVLFAAMPNAWAAAAVHVLGNVGVLLLLRRGCRALRPLENLPPSATVELALGGAAVVLLLPARLWHAHPAELAIPILWLAAAAAARRGRWVAAGALFGVATGWETWAILALPMLLLLKDPRAILRSSAVWLALALCLYLPFVVSGSFQLFHHVWPVVQGTPVNRLFPQIKDITWQLRALEAAASTTACALVVVILRRSTAVVWLAPLAAVLVRFVFDPYIIDYYWLAVTALTFAGLCCVSKRSTRIQVVSLIALACLSFMTDGRLVADVSAAILLLIMAVAAGRTTRLPTAEMIAIDDARGDASSTEAEVESSGWAPPSRLAGSDSWP